MVECYPRFPFAQEAYEEQEESRILVSETEFGHEVRRDKWAGKRRRMFNVRYDVLSRDEEERLWEFYVRHKSSQRIFYFPSFNRDAKLVSNYAGSTELHVTDITRFSGISNEYGNRVLLFGQSGPYTLSGVTAGLAQMKFTDSSLAGALADDYWNGAWVVANTGPNRGLWRPVADYDGTAATFTLGKPFPYDMTATDSINIIFWETQQITTSDVDSRRLTGTATGGSTSTVVDSTNITGGNISTPNDFVGGIVEFTSGDNNFQKRTIYNVNTGTNTISFYPDVDTSIASGVSYVVLSREVIRLDSALQFKTSSYTYDTNDYVEAVLPKARFVSSTQDKRIFSRELREKGLEIVEAFE